jgi:hypothetical protein
MSDPRDAATAMVDALVEAAAARLGPRLVNTILDALTEAAREGDTEPKRQLAQALDQLKESEERRTKLREALRAAITRRDELAAELKEAQKRGSRARKAATTDTVGGNGGPSSGRVKGRPWTDEDDATVREMYDKGAGDREIAATLGRSLPAVRQRRTGKLGLRRRD